MRRSFAVVACVGCLLLPACGPRGGGGDAVPAVAPAPAPEPVVSPPGLEIAPPPRPVPPYFEQVEGAEVDGEVYAVFAKGEWRFQHPTGIREVNELHLPLGRPVKLTLISADGPVRLVVPAWHLSVEAANGRYLSATFVPRREGQFDFATGTGQAGEPKTAGFVRVVKAEEYEHWALGRKPGADSPAAEGRQLFRKLQCVECHGGNRETPRAPSLVGVYGSKVRLEGGGTVVADEVYIRESIRNPKAKVVEGWKPIMPHYDPDQVSEEDLSNLIAYIKSLKDGKEPPQERFPPPAGPPQPAPPPRPRG